MLPPGHPLYFTITATNSMGLSSSVQCLLPNYDVTLPAGRFTLAFKSTSRTDTLDASLFIADDSPIIDEKVVMSDVLKIIYKI